MLSLMARNEATAENLPTCVLSSPLSSMMLVASETGGWDLARKLASMKK